MLLSDFYFDLPSDLIARFPLVKRSESRLLCLDGKTGNILHRCFKDILELIQPGDLLIFNNTKVIPARLLGKKNTGGKVEILIERLLDSQSALAQIKASKSVRIGDDIILTPDERMTIKAKKNHFYEIFYPGKKPLLSLIESRGEVPLPPYMHRQATEFDRERYQTIYAKEKGSVAAPTAGFHFDEEIFQVLQEKKVQMDYLTLHIGAGTFMPVRVDNVKDHKMHAEFVTVPDSVCQRIQNAKACGQRVIAVGTTTLRALESASISGETKPYHSDTDIFIYPGFKFNCVDVLITNLHLPSSTLLMLVCAFAGQTNVLKAYNEAINQAYRFYSYGDAMWIESRLG